MTTIDMINEEYKHNIALAFRLGMNVPRIIYFDKAPEEELAEIDNNKRYWRIKDYFAIEKKKGMRVTSTGYILNGVMFYTSSIHRKNLLSGGMGEEMEENLITLFHNHGSPVESAFEKIIEFYPEYKGIVQFDLLIDNTGIIWYENIRFGATLEYLICLAYLHVDDVELFDIKDIGFKNGFTVGCSVYQFPNVGTYDFEEEYIYEGSYTAFAVNKDDQVREAWKGLYSNLSKIENICYRNDGGKKEEKQWHSMRKRNLA